MSQNVSFRFAVLLFCSSLLKEILLLFLILILIPKTETLGDAKQ